MKVIKEWFINAKWGKIALISWGDPHGEPILLVHGRQDSAATFLPLLELMPAGYHYVGFDLPGHGLSDAFPIGVAVTRFINVVALDTVVHHLGWTDFTYIAHSLGAEIGLFYHAIYPNQIKKLILLDPEPALQRIMIDNYPDFYSYYHNYYEKYRQHNSSRVYSKAAAIEAVMKARDMTASQAEVILSRNLRKIGEDLYSMSWDKRLRQMPPTNFPLDYYYQIFSKNTPPTLCIQATETKDFYPPGKENARKLFADLEKNLKNFTVLRVDGNHDVHFLHPERISVSVCSFMQKQFKRSKL